MSGNLPAITKVQSLSEALAKKLDLGIGGQDLIETLKDTAFKGQVSDSQMAALLIIASQYRLNPWTKEIYAYPDKQNGIVPVVGVDGWSRIINEHPKLNGLEFRYSEETLTHKGRVAHVWIECVITRKDRDHPIAVREYFDEVCRSVSFVTPWDTHPKRMHRHKSLIQCARLAFGFAGIYDEDEAERILEKDITPRSSAVVEPSRPTIEKYSEESFKENFPKWEKLILSGKKSAEDIIAMIESRHILSDYQLSSIRAIGLDGGRNEEN